jgi:hypothetical protein
VADEIRRAVKEWGIAPVSVAAEVFDQIERLEKDPFLGSVDDTGLFAGTRIYQFRIERLPIILRASVFYDFAVGDDGENIITVLDFWSRFVRGERPL